MSKRIWNLQRGGALSATVGFAVWSVFDELVQKATANQELVAAARRMFSEQNGLIEPGHELFAARSDAFVEWFLLEFVDADGLTQVERSLCSLPTTDQAYSCLTALRSSHRSLFQVARSWSGRVLLDDLIGGGRFLVEDDRRFPEISEDDLFEARVLPVPGRYWSLCLGRALQFHPREAASSIRTQIRRATERAKTRAEILSRLSRLHARCFAYRHVSPARIYSQTTD